MLKLALTVMAIALPDCVNPTLIGGELFVATGPRPRRRVVVFTIVAWTVTFAVGIVLVLGLGDLILALVPKPGRTVKYAIITAAGVALLGGGIVMWLRRADLVNADTGQSSRRAGGSAAVLGASIAGIELLTAFPYFAAIALIVGADVSTPSEVVLVALYCVVYTLPLIVIAGVFLASGDRAERRLQPIDTWLRSHWPLIVAPLTAIMGTAVLVFGVVELVRT